MTRRDSVFDRIRTGTGGLFSQLSGELMQSPAFMKAVQRALQGKELLDRAATRALKQASIPTRTEFKRALGRIEALESELDELREAVRVAQTTPARAGRKRASTNKASTGHKTKQKAGPRRQPKKA